MVATLGQYVFERSFLRKFDPWIHNDECVAVADRVQNVVHAQEVKADAFFWGEQVREVDAKVVFQARDARRRGDCVCSAQPHKLRIDMRRLWG